MFTSNKRNIYVISLIISITFFASNNFLTPIYGENEGKQEIDNNISFDKNFSILPLGSYYSTNFTDDGIISATLLIHQSYKNESLLKMTESNSTYHVPAPNATDFTTYYTNIAVNNIKASNHSETIEDNYISNQIITNTPWAASFSVPTDCYLTNASFNFEKGLINNADGTMSVYLYNSTISGEPDSDSLRDIGMISITGDGWTSDEFDLANTFLNNSLTENNKWFIGLVSDGQTFFEPHWRFDMDTSGDDSDVHYATGPTTWAAETAIDYDIELGLSLNKTEVIPTEINLQINGISVNNNTNAPSHNSGFWNRTGDSSTTNNMLLNFTADWFNYYFEVNQTQLNYTKTFSIDSNYTVESGSKVFWNSSTEIDAFDYRLDNNTINITIPSSWTPGFLKNYPNTVSYSTFDNDTTEIITVFGSNAEDGDWSLVAESDNLLGTSEGIEIGTISDGIEKALVYSNDTIKFNATFSKEISGIVNITIYNTTDDVNFAFSSNASISDNTFTEDFKQWDITQNISYYGYGEYRLQAVWNNDS
ncbi:MAG: hypothetical protein GY870_06575, partial [archaeon]|nr:hypothetical protein [archaeon]